MPWAHAPQWGCEHSQLRRRSRPRSPRCAEGSAAQDRCGHRGGSRRADHRCHRGQLPDRSHGSIHDGAGHLGSVGYVVRAMQAIVTAVGTTCCRVRRTVDSCQGRRRCRATDRCSVPSAIDSVGFRRHRWTSSTAVPRSSPGAAVASGHRQGSRDSCQSGNRWGSAGRRGLR